MSADSLKGKVGKVREAYIEAAMAHLSQEASDPKPASQQRIQRCLTLLKVFFLLLLLLLKRPGDPDSCL